MSQKRSKSVYSESVFKGSYIKIAVGCYWWPICKPSKTLENQPQEKTLGGFWKLWGYCHPCITIFTTIAKSLCEILKRRKSPLSLESPVSADFYALKEKLLRALALALSRVTKPFHLFVLEKDGADLGILTQTLECWHCPVATYHSNCTIQQHGGPFARTTWLPLLYW